MTSSTVVLDADLKQQNQHDSVWWQWSVAKQVEGCERGNQTDQVIVHLDNEEL